MKNLVKILTIVLIAGLSFETNAQRNATKKTVKTTTTQKVSKAPTKVNRSNVEYKKTTKKVTTVRNLPNKPQVIKHNGNSIYYDNKSFYRLNGGRYMPTVPSVGFRINVLPVGHRTITFRNRNFYVYDGIYYSRVGNQYEVINPEIGSVIYELPLNVEKVVVNNRKLYEFNNVLYERVQINGARAYEVVGFIEG